MDNESELPEELKEAATVSNTNIAIFSFFILGTQKRNQAIKMSLFFLTISQESQKK
jgi:hypothetical protein